MNAIILAIGDELVSGQTVDTNSAYLADALILRGIETSEHVTVGDCEQAVCQALLNASRQADIVLVTGGLGPTKDDLTRQALARAMGSELVLHEPSLERMREFFRRLGRDMVDDNNIQAMIPRGARPIDNDMGTAPGLAATLNDAKIFITPGVPREMRHMFQTLIAPDLPNVGRTIHKRVIHTFGSGESDVSAQIADLMTARTGDEVIGTTVADGLVSIRITVKAADEAAAQSRSDALETELRSRLGEIVIGKGEKRLAEVTGDLLRDSGQTLATAESCTGGMIGQMITDPPGASEYYLGGVVAYANTVKIAALGVPAEVLEAEGAVSEAVARAMATGCRERFSSHWAISVTGIAGPGGGSKEKPVGLVYIGVAGPHGCDVHRHMLPHTRQHIRVRAARTAINHLRLAIMHSS